MARVLVVDDSRETCEFLEELLGTLGLEVTKATHPDRAIELLHHESFDLLLSDINLEAKKDGLDLLREAKPLGVDTILLSGFGTLETAIEAVREGAFDFLSKPWNNEELKALVSRALARRQSSGHGTVPGSSPKAKRSLMIGSSPKMMAVYKTIASLQNSRATVLITGESGTGKEVVADTIHAWSARANGPLIKINCAAIPETLLESELFGHEKGSFTGASAMRVGRFEEADGGTIFLDEITEMSPGLQAKLLRVTQDGKFQRIGSNREIRTNARILAASNRDLEAEVKAGRFREDLFYRLNVVELNLPPLRERREDILPLANLFTAEFARNRARLAEATVNCLQNYVWPGNVRELRNAIERAVLLSQSELILPEHLPAKLREAVKSAAPQPAVDAQTMDEIERHAILAALKQQKSNRTETAKALGISRRALLYKLQRLRQQGFEFE